MSAADKNKLAGIAAGAEVNQSAFSNVMVGSFLFWNSVFIWILLTIMRSKYTLRGYNPCAIIYSYIIMFPKWTELHIQRLFKRFY